MVGAGHSTPPHPPLPHPPHPHPPCQRCSIQAGGITLWATSKGSGTPNASQINTGNYITLSGLAFQLFGFCLFTILAIWVQRHPRCVRACLWGVGGGGDLVGLPGWVTSRLTIWVLCHPRCVPACLPLRAPHPCMSRLTLPPAPALAVCRNTLRGTQEGRKLFTGLYITVVFLFIRNIFRFAEFAQVGRQLAPPRAPSPPCAASPPARPRPPPSP